MLIRIIREIRVPLIPNVYKMTTTNVSIICPIRNEVKYIAKCLDSIVHQDFPNEKMEILIIDGMSNDGTRKIIEEFMKKNKNIYLLDNPGQTVPFAMNIGIKRSKGKIIFRVDGHCFLENDFVRKCVELLQRVKNADCVGGPIKSVSENFIDKGISIAMSTPFGVGNVRFRYSQKEGYVDTLAFGAYRREVFDRIGLFDEELVRNQDDELNLRLIKAGGKIFLSPEIKSYYFSRSSLKALWKQYFQYGLWKVRVIQKHKMPASWRHLIPGAFVLSLLCSFILSFYMKIGLFVFIGILTFYFTISFVTSLVIASKKEVKYVLLLPVVFTVLHFSYGIGFLVGVIKFFSKWF